MEYKGRPVVTIAEACRKTGVCRRTICNWMKKRRIGYIKTAGARVFILEDTLWREAR